MKCEGKVMYRFEHLSNGQAISFRIKLYGIYKLQKIFVMTIPAKVSLLISRINRNKSDRANGKLAIPN